MKVSRLSGSVDDSSPPPPLPTHHPPVAMATDCCHGDSLHPFPLTMAQFHLSETVLSDKTLTLHSDLYLLVAQIKSNNHKSLSWI